MATNLLSSYYYYYYYYYYCYHPSSSYYYYYYYYNNNQSVQVEASLSELRAKATPINRFAYLQSLQDTNERLFYTLLIEHINEILPIV